MSSDTQHQAPSANSSTSGPPQNVGALARRERSLAYTMLLPTFFIVLSIVIIPLAANFWISFKSVELGDLRAARPMINEQLRPKPKTDGQEVILRYRIRNSSKKEALGDLVFTDEIPDGLSLIRLGLSARSRIRRCPVRLAILKVASDWI